MTKESQSKEGGSKGGRGSSAAMAKGGRREEGKGEEDSEDEEEELAEEDLRKDTKAPRILDRVKGETVHHNPEFEKFLKEREAAELVPYLQKNRRAVSAASAENATLPHNLRRHEEQDLSFMEVDGRRVETFIYSGQTLNSAELQKAAMREEMEKTIHKEFFSYNVEFNSGLMGAVNTENLLRIEDTLRQVTPGTNPIPWRYPKTRTKESFVRAGVDWQDISDARKDELKDAWVEEQTGSKLSRGKVMKGVFDPRSLGRGRHEIIATRRSGLDPGRTRETELEEEERQAKEKRAALEAAGTDDNSSGGLRSD